MESLLWRACCGVFACGEFAMESFLWRVSLWRVSCGEFACLLACLLACLSSIFSSHFSLVCHVSTFRKPLTSRLDVEKGTEVYIDVDPNVQYLSSKLL